MLFWVIKSIVASNTRKINKPRASQLAPIHHLLLRRSSLEELTWSLPNLSRSSDLDLTMTMNSDLDPTLMQKTVLPPSKEC